MSHTHHYYSLDLVWTGNLGTGTATYRGYSRDHTLSSEHTSMIEGSSDPAFRGDPARWNPELLFVASLAQCHMLWYLHLAVRSEITVTDYIDLPTGTMLEESNGSGRFSEVTLRPRVTVTADSDTSRALALHGEVGNYCFIARSVNIPVLHEPEILVADA